MKKKTLKVVLEGTNRIKWKDLYTFKNYFAELETEMRREILQMRTTNAIIILYASSSLHVEVSIFISCIFPVHCKPYSCSCECQRLFGKIYCLWFRWRNIIERDFSDVKIKYEKKSWTMHFLVFIINTWTCTFHECQRFARVSLTHHIQFFMPCQSESLSNVNVSTLIVLV